MGKSKPDGYDGIKTDARVGSYHKQAMEAQKEEPKHDLRFSPPQRQEVSLQLSQASEMNPSFRVVREAEPATIGSNSTAPSFQCFCLTAHYVPKQQKALWKQEL